MVVSVASVGSAAGAAAYYANDNYYTAEQSAEHSEWGGDGAARLELSGKVDAEVFEQVLAGKLPNGATISGGAGEHVAGMDLTFSAPKSVSLIALIGGDKRVIAAHIQAVRTTMAWVEKNLAYARQGANGRETLATGKLVYALFPHDVSRAHDPQLHVHAVIANATQRPDGAWRALRNTELYKQNTLIGAIYNAELRASLEKLGYAVEMTGKHGSFEIAGIDRATIEQWSTRRGEIVGMARELGISSPEGLHAIAERTRDAKTEMTRGELAQHWEGLANERGLDLGPLVSVAREASPQRNVFDRVRAWGKSLLDRATQAFGPKPEPLMRDAEPTPRGAALAAAYTVAAGVRHLTERQATFQPYELLRAALNFGSHGARIDGIEARVEALVARGMLLGRNVDGIAHMTTRDVLRTERNWSSAPWMVAGEPPRSSRRKQQRSTWPKPPMRKASPCRTSRPAPRLPCCPARTATNSSRAMPAAARPRYLPSYARLLTSTATRSLRSPRSTASRVSCAPKPVWPWIPSPDFSPAISARRERARPMPSPGRHATSAARSC